MITLKSLSSDRDPSFSDLELAIDPGELPAVVCPDEAERVAFVNLLAGFTPESGGSFLADGEELGPAERQQAVVSLLKWEALGPDQTAKENAELVALMRGVSPDKELIAQLMTFAGIDNPKARPAKLTADQRLRLTIALQVLGNVALVVALDPPPEVVAILPELRQPGRALLMVVPNLGGAEAVATKVYSLVQGRLAEGVSASQVQERNQRYRLRLSLGKVGPQALLAHFPGVTINEVGGEYVLDVSPEVSCAQVIRQLVQGGVVVQTLREEQVRSGRR